MHVAAMTHRHLLSTQLRYVLQDCTCCTRGWIILGHCSLNVIHYLGLKWHLHTYTRTTAVSKWCTMHINIITIILMITNHKCIQVFTSFHLWQLFYMYHPAPNFQKIHLENHVSPKYGNNIYNNYPIPVNVQLTSSTHVYRMYYYTFSDYECDWYLMWFCMSLYSSRYGSSILSLSDHWESGDL